MAALPRQKLMSTCVAQCSTPSSVALCVREKISISMVISSTMKSDPASAECWEGLTPAAFCKYCEGKNERCIISAGACISIM